MPQTLDLIGFTGLSIATASGKVGEREKVRKHIESGVGGASLPSKAPVAK